MSGAPQFPTPGWVGAQPLRPGASAHKAGLSLEQRIAALENGAASRPGPGVVDGSVPVADAAAQGGMGWRTREIATQIYSAGTGAVASGSTLATFTLTGDGATAILIEGQYDIDNSASGNWVSLRVFDSTVGGGATVMQENIKFLVTTALRRSWNVAYRVPPFTGTKDITVKLVASGGTTTVYAGNTGSGGNSLGCWARWI